MTNPVKGEALLSLKDGSEFVLVLDFGGLIEAEQAYGKPMARMMAEAQAGFMGAIRALLWGALRRNHSNVTMAQATAMLMEGQAEVLEAITTAIELSMPESSGASAEGDNRGNPKPRRAGKTSGGNGAKRG